MYSDFHRPDCAQDVVPAVCPDALDRLWQAAYGAGAVPVPDGERGRSHELWRPFDAEQPVMALLRACTSHMAQAQTGAATHGHLLTRLLLLSLWLCSEEARVEAGRLTAWTREGRNWRLFAVHRDLLRAAASCADFGALPRARST